MGPDSFLVPGFKMYLGSTTDSHIHIMKSSFCFQWFECVSFACNSVFPETGKYLLKKLSNVLPMNSKKMLTKSWSL